MISTQRGTEFEVAYSINEAGAYEKYEVSFTKDQPKLERVTSRPATSILTRGFVDMHIHGAFGIDFMEASKEEMQTLCSKLKDIGYEMLIPTTITSRQGMVTRAIDNLPDDPMIGGFHLEGPFISPIFPGAQPIDFIASPEDLTEYWMNILNHPKLKVITLAPEIEGAGKLIHYLRAKYGQYGSIKIGMGHTNATFSEAAIGKACGATHTTHTFNAMRPFHHREAGTVGFALSDYDFPGELIYDRLHVCKEAAGLLLKLKSPSNVMAISDGTKASGMTEVWPPGTEVDMWGLKAVMGEKSIRLPDGTLAGSAITLYDAFQNIADDFGIETAIRMTSLNPSRFLDIKTSQPRTLRLDLNYKLTDIFEHGILG